MAHAFKGRSKGENVERNVDMSKISMKHIQFVLFKD